ncbi:MAG: hypothetical protein V4679_12725, partial [Pseudomonadota bacterium]
MPVTTATTPPLSSPSRATRQRQQPPRSGRAPAARLALAALPLVLLVACGGGDGDAGPVTPPPVTPPVTGYTVGGTVAGLGEGRNLVLQVQGADDLTVAANGSFVMGRRFELYGTAVITVASHPEGQRCSVVQPTLVVLSAANITDVSVGCETLPAGTRNLGGVVTGLVLRSPLVLQNNQGDNLTASADGRFVFNTAVASGATYAVQVQTQPAGQTCSVANASGTVGSSDVRSVQVACTGLPLAAPEGVWAAEKCFSGFDINTREYLNIWREGESRASIAQGSVTKWGPFCLNPGNETLDGRPVESVVFDRQETRGAVTAFWGTQTGSTGTRRVVWARKGPYLCLLPRKTSNQPAPIKDYPTIASVEQDTDEAIQGSS